MRYRDARTQRHPGTPLANGSALRPEFRPYRYREDTSQLRRDLAAAILAKVGREADAWDLPEPKVTRRVSPRYVQPCGTNAAYQRHLQHGEQPCEPCREAHKAILRERWRAKYAHRADEAPKGRADVAERLALLATMRLQTTSSAYPEPGVVTHREAAERLGVHVRTIERYVKRLQEAS